MGATKDLSQFYGGLTDARDLLKAYAEQRDVSFLGSGLELWISTSTGMVFLEDYEGNMGILQEDKVVQYFSCPGCGYEGTQRAALGEDCDFIKYQGYCSAKCATESGQEIDEGPNFDEYKIEPERAWQENWRYGDGYNVMGLVGAIEWYAVGAWGKKGYDLGSWPYVIIFFRDKEDDYGLVYYVEGDVTQYKCPTKEIREQITDGIAFWHWRHDDEEWVQDYGTVDQLPAELRGPYGGDEE